MQAPHEPGVSERGAHARRLFDDAARRYDIPAAVFGLGQYGRWRHALVAGLDLAPKARVLDVATGTGLVAGDIARRYEARVTGLDQSAEMLARACERGEPGVVFVRGDGQRIPFADDSFDAVTFTYLLRYVDDPASTIAELARVLKPGGVMGSVEFGVPPNAAVRAAWQLYGAAIFPVLSSAVSPGWRRIGTFLRGSIATFDERFPPERLEQLWRDAGLHGVRTKRMSLGGGVITWGRKRG